MSRARLTLARSLVLCFVALATVLMLLLSLFYAGSRRTLLVASDRLMAQATKRVTERVEGHLGEAERLISALESEVRIGVVRIDSSDTVELGLASGLSDHPRVTEATLTSGHAVGVYDADEPGHDAGDLRLAPDSGRQISALREDQDTIVVQRLQPSGDRWMAIRRNLSPAPKPSTQRFAVADPTLHATFTVPSRPENKGRALWSDLSYAEADSALPEPERRRVVSLQKALWSTTGDFLGALRVSLLSDRIDELVAIRVDETASAVDDHVVFICDRHGRLVSRLGPSDRFALLDDSGKPDDDGDVRVVPDHPSAQVLAALHVALTEEVPLGGSLVRRVVVKDAPYLVSLASLLEDRTRGWLLGIVVPEAHYVGDLEAARRRALFVSAIVMLLAVAAGAVILRAVRQDLGRLVRGMSRLKRFDFSPLAAERETFNDVAEAADGLEQAKTALRALGKYVPLDLVRQLYEARMEPALGGRIEDVTILFSDIESFTSVAERLPPNDLATALGAYLETLTRAVHSTGGIIDKYTGDGVMALWNTPRPCEGHAERACAAALAAIETTEALYASEKWRGLAPWRTRFGIHRAEVSVGHFGAPDRMSFTAMGDGVNLASRLESLNKLYGTRILVSSVVERAARETFCFRRVDRVAVKGKEEGTDVFELIGRRGMSGERSAVIEGYERALDAYFRGDFSAALVILRDQTEDPPSRVLAARCERFLRDPPPPDWMGIFVVAEK